MAVENIVEEYIRTHAGSQKLHGRAEKVFAADGATHVARLLSPFRPYITHAKGSRKWDIDGNEYIDYSMGHGALILGHSQSRYIWHSSQYPLWQMTGLNGQQDLNNGN